jgi:hypothetical protein
MNRTGHAVNSRTGRPVLTIVAAVFAGAISAAVMSTWMSAYAHPKRSAESAPDRTSGPEPLVAPAERPTANRAEGLEQLSALDRRLAKLEAADASPVPGSAAEAPIDHRRKHEDDIQRHRAEPVDTGWGPRTNRLLSADFEKAKGWTDFDLVSVDCRTTTCAAVLQWDSHEQAAAHYGEIVRNLYRADCERSIVIPDTPADNGHWQATMIFDCTDWRANGAEPLPDIAPPARPRTEPATTK